MRRKMGLAMLLLSMACVVFAQGVQEVNSVELLVSAAASTTDCMKELGQRYQAEHPEVKIQFNFGSSGALQQQIEQGAPVDVFLSAAQKQMKALQTKGLMIDSSVRDLLENKVVLITSRTGMELASFEKLPDLSVTKIAIGDPQSVPAGQYAKQVFDSLGITESISSRLIYAKDVREVLSWVETGNVDVGVVYETDSKIFKQVRVSAYAPEGTHSPVIYPVGVLKQSKQVDDAVAFVDFLFSEEAKAIFASYGFSVL